MRKDNLGLRLMAMSLKNSPYVSNSFRPSGQDDTKESVSEDDEEQTEEAS